MMGYNKKKLSASYQVTYILPYHPLYVDTDNWITNTAEREGVSTTLGELSQTLKLLSKNILSIWVQPSKKAISRHCPFKFIRHKPAEKPEDFLYHILWIIYVALYGFVVG